MLNFGNRPKPAAVFPAGHLFSIALSDQPTPDKGAQGASPHLRLHRNDGRLIQPDRRMKHHARRVIRLGSGSRLEPPSMSQQWK